MYLHIGGDVLIPLKDIIMIINLEDLELSTTTKDFLELARLDKNIKGCEPAIAKSGIVTTKAVYYSSISTHTLWRRSLDKSLYPG